jgi:hypothetical protein
MFGTFKLGFDINILGFFGLGHTVLVTFQKNGRIFPNLLVTLNLTTGNL